MIKCKYYKTCTGCTQLHEPYQKQINIKESTVAKAMGSLLSQHSVPILPMVQSPNPLAYRSSVKLCLHEDSLEHRSIGLYKKGTKIVVSIPDCPAHLPAINELSKKLFTLRGRVPAPFYNHKGKTFQKGKLKYLTVRQGHVKGRTENLGAIISHTGVSPDAMREWLKVSGLTKLCVYHSPLSLDDGDDVIGKDVFHLSGPELFPLTLGEQSYLITPMAFFQANLLLSPTLIQEAGGFTEKNGDVLLDLYGGFGAYSFPIAKQFQKIYVIDGNAAATATANAHAKKFGVSNLSAESETCEKFLAKLPDEIAKKVTHVIVNPPRSGLSLEVARLLNRRNFPRLKALHYVSCNPETLSRDLAILLKKGIGSLRLKNLQPFDMFPQTDHVETLARLY